jgi:hypothetical protein
LAFRALDPIALDVFAIARQHVVAHAAFMRTAHGGLAHAVGGNGDLAALLHILDRTRRSARPHGLAHERTGAAQEALTVGEAFATWIEATVDDVHDDILTPFVIPTGRCESGDLVQRARWNEVPCRV